MVSVLDGGVHAELMSVDELFERQVETAGRMIAAAIAAGVFGAS